MKQLVPGLGPLAHRVVSELRRQEGWESWTLDPPALLRIAAVGDFLFAYARARYAEGWSRDAAAADGDYLASHVLYLINFELHGRKTFWVDESLAWMLSQTELDIVGRCLHLPFPACAFVFADPGTLELAESLLSLESECSARGQPLRSVTAYVIRGEPAGEGKPLELNFSFLFDAQNGRWPYLVTRDLFVHPDDHLEAILDSHVPSVVPQALDALFHAPELKKLIHLVINACLYATSSHLAPIVLRSSAQRLHEALAHKGPRKRARLERRAAGREPAVSLEDVFHLPGRIDISRIKYLSELPRTETGRTLMARFMVRGHWRRANPDWKDQRLRWVEPYWKGPELATVIEREYRLKP